MRAAALRTPVLAGVVGAVAGCLVALVGQWWVSRDATTDFGWYSYSPLANADDITVHPTLADSWFGLLWPAALSGLVVGVIAVMVLTVRRRGVRPFPRGGRGVLALAALGIVLGGVAAGALYLRAGPDDGVIYSGRYVPLQGVETSEAYESTLSVTVDNQPGYSFFAVCGGAGLAAGLVTAAVIAVARRRGIPRGTAGAA